MSSAGTGLFNIYDMLLYKLLPSSANLQSIFLSREGIKFALAKSIALQGIKPSLFFTKPFEKAFERLPDELVEAYGLDVEQFLEYTINKK